MVERYPVYKSQLGISSLPSVDFTQLKEQSKNYSNVADAMAKMSNYFFKEAGEAAAIEGAEYGASQPVTKEQLEMAASSGIEPDVLKDDYSIFGKAARDAAILAGSDNMEAQAKRSFVEIVTAGLQNGTPSGEIQKQLDSVTLGFSNALMEVSPVAAQKLNATLSVSASSAWQSYVNDEITQYSKQTVATLTNLTENFKLVDLPNLAKAGVPDDVNIDNAFYILRENILNKMRAVRGTSSSLISTTSDTLYNAWVQSKKDAIINWTLENLDTSHQKLVNIADGEFNNPHIGKLYNSLKGEERTSFLKDLNTKVDEAFQAQFAYEDMLDIRGQRIVKKNVNGFYDALFRNDSVMAEDYLKTILQYDRTGETYSSVAKAYKERDKYGTIDGTIEYFVKRDTFLTTKEVEAEFFDEKLSLEDFEKWMKIARANEDANVKDALNEAAFQLGFDDTYQKVLLSTGRLDASYSREELNEIKKEVFSEYLDYQELKFTNEEEYNKTTFNPRAVVKKYLSEKKDVNIEKNFNQDKQYLKLIFTASSKFASLRDKDIKDYTVQDIELMEQILKEDPGTYNDAKRNNIQTKINKILEHMNR